MSAVIIEDNFDVTDSGRGIGPRLGCVGCQEDVRTDCSASPQLYQRYGVDGPIHTLDCPNCMESIVGPFAV